MKHAPCAAVYAGRESGRGRGGVVSLHPRLVAHSLMEQKMREKKRSCGARFVENEDKVLLITLSVERSGDRALLATTGGEKVSNRTISPPG